MEMPTLTQLRYAVAVADQAHFGRAAAQCGVSQPALSSQIKQLEERLGTSVFERTSRRVHLTPRGREIVLHARRVLRDADELVAVARGETDPLTGSLYMGVIPTVAPYVLPLLLPEVRRRYPHLRLYLREDQTARLVEQLRGDRLDVLLLALPLDEPGVNEHAVFTDPFVLATPPHHPLAAPDAVTEKELSGAEILLLEEGHCLRDHALDVCKESGAAEAGATRATSLGTLVQMVANGIGMTLLPSIAVGVEARDPRELVVRPFTDPQPSRTIGLAWRQSATDVRDYLLIGETLADIVSDAFPAAGILEASPRSVSPG
ncbi:MAG: LysR family transcriptional regulator [Acidimicrobiia bacterium]|nr:LysR family transcriptional regulator [Acidimicrobiia bacterium]